MRCLKLPFQFDPARLRADLAQVASEEWIPHINRRHYDGQWSGAALRSLGGSATDLLPEARGAAGFSDTGLLGRCPYFREVLSHFRCPLLSVRLLCLHAGSNIAEHVDHALDFDDGEVRIHIPIVTSDDVKFYLDGSRLVMAPGECWYTNVNLPHSVENGGSTDRIHLVIDCRVDAWLREVFAAAPRLLRAHYGASLALATPPGLTELLHAFSRLAAPSRERARRPEFHAGQRTLVLQWRQERTWQLRLALPQGSGPTADARWIAQLESSPDPGGNHRGDYDQLLQCLRETFPALAVVEETG